MPWPRGSLSPAPVNLCCSSARFPMCSWTEDTASAYQGDTLGTGPPHPTPAAPHVSHGRSRSSSGPASSSPLIRPSKAGSVGVLQGWHASCSNPPPGLDGLCRDWEEARPALQSWRPCSVPTCALLDAPPTRKLFLLSSMDLFQRHLCLALERWKRGPPSSPGMTCVTLPPSLLQRCS